MVEKFVFKTMSGALEPTGIQIEYSKKVKTVRRQIDFQIATREDSTALFPIWSDYQVTRFTLIRDIKSEADCETRIARQKERIEKEGGLGPFCVRNSGRIIGYCGATIVGGNASEYEIFYNIGREYWNRGFGTEIAKELLRMLFEGSLARKAIAFSVVKNEASWKILEKIGMSRVEELPEDFENSEGMFDLFKYEISRNAL